MGGAAKEDGGSQTGCPAAYVAPLVAVDCRDSIRVGRLRRLDWSRSLQIFAFSCLPPKRPLATNPSATHQGHGCHRLSFRQVKPHRTTPWQTPWDGPVPAGNPLPRSGLGRCARRSLAPCCRVGCPCRRSMPGILCPSPAPAASAGLWLVPRFVMQQELTGAPLSPTTPDAQSTGGGIAPRGPDTVELWIRAESTTTGGTEGGQETSGSCRRAK